MIHTPSSGPFRSRRRGAIAWSVLAGYVLTGALAVPSPASAIDERQAEELGLTPESEFDEGLREVVAAERAFAAQCAREGTKAAFLHWLRPDATVFTPEPAAAGEFYGALDASRQPRLVWAPARVELSAAGDLAISTGPYRLEPADGGAPRHGRFFSVWQRQPDGSWRVVADLGVTQEEPVELPERAWGHRVELKAPRIQSIPVARPLVEGLEHELLTMATEVGLDAAVARRATDAVQVLVEGAPVRVGREALRAEADTGVQGLVRYEVELAGAAAANSNDFAAGWGITTRTVVRTEGADAETVGREAFVRVWRREETQWLVAFEVRVPLDPGSEHP